jgi:hypothetical protein
MLPAMRTNAPPTHLSRSASSSLLASGLLTLVLLPGSARCQLAAGDLSKLGDYESRRSSSFDRKGANRDYVSVDPGQTVTIFDEDGPGEIRHMWITLPNWSEVYAHQKMVLRAYWYQLEPHAPFPPLPPVEKRIPKLAWTGGPGQDPEME